MTSAPITRASRAPGKGGVVGNDQHVQRVAVGGQGLGNETVMARVMEQAEWRGRSRRKKPR